MSLIRQIKGEPDYVPEILAKGNGQICSNIITGVLVEL